MYSFLISIWSLVAQSIQHVTYIGDEKIKHITLNNCNKIFYRAFNCALKSHKYVCVCELIINRDRMTLIFSQMYKLIKDHKCCNL